MKNKKWRPAQNQDYVLKISSSIDIDKNSNDNKWLRKIQNQLCPNCGWPSQHWYPKSVDMALTRTFRSTIGRCDATGPLIISKSFYELLAPYNTTASIGNCYVRSSQGYVLDTKYITLYDIEPNMVEVRGSIEHGLDNQCELCHVRIKWIEGHQWVRRSELGDRLWFTEDVSLFISRWVDASIPWKKFPDVKKYRVYIRDDDTSDKIGNTASIPAMIPRRSNKLIPAVTDEHKSNYLIALEELVRVCRKRGSDAGVSIRAATPQELSMLHGIKFNDTALTLFKWAVLDSSVMHGVRVLSPSDIITECRELEPGMDVSPRGFPVVGTTSYGDVICLDCCSAPGPNGLSQVILLNHEYEWRDASSEEIAESGHVIAESYIEFIALVAEEKLKI
ncbi:MAG: hypothetical protein KF864_03770 [Phycisphaeraceae bacterium]|nr:hypothetical protein [Phycisphaeraceae bacterium]